MIQVIIFQYVLQQTVYILKAISKINKLKTKVVLDILETIFVL